jgi:hypothetical protein
MFEWGGGCLWCGNQASIADFDVGPIENRLKLSPAILTRLRGMTAWHDRALNWDYPPDPGPWPAEEYERFDKTVVEVPASLRCELGPEFEIEYTQL